MPLKGIPEVLSPDILHVLSSAGHGDEIILADSNFPSASICKSGPTLVRADGIKIPVLLEAVLKLLPIDYHTSKPVAVMEVVASDKAKGFGTPPIWNTYRKLINTAESREVEFDLVDRFEFYERSKKAFAVIHTGENALYGNIILKKGVVVNE